MRVTKKTVSEAINKWFDDMEIPYEVKPENIHKTHFTSNDYEAGATHHLISAKHKTEERYSDIYIYTMSSFKYMQEEMKKFGSTKMTVKSYAHTRQDLLNDLWLIHV